MFLMMMMMMVIIIINNDDSLYNISLQFNWLLLGGQWWWWWSKFKWKLLRTQILFMFFSHWLIHESGSNIIIFFKYETIFLFVNINAKIVMNNMKKKILNGCHKYCLFPEVDFFGFNDPDDDVWFISINSYSIEKKLNQQSIGINHIGWW